MKRALTLLLALSLLVACDRQPVEDQPIPSGDSRVVNLTQPLARKFLLEHEQDPDLVILDVRTPEEFTQGHIPGAILVNFNSPGFEREVQKLDPSKTYFVYCHSGGRSSHAIPVLLQAGVNKIYHLQRGVSMGFPIVPKPPQENLKTPGQLDLIGG